MNENINSEFQQDYQRIEALMVLAGANMDEATKWQLKMACKTMVTNAILTIGNETTSLTKAIKI